MLKIVLGKLKERSNDLANFLEGKHSIKSSIEGDEIILDDEEKKVKLKKRFVKTYLKRYLYKNDLKKTYRVLVEGDRLMFVELKFKE